MASALLDALQADIKTAMKSREADTVVALRTLLAQVKDATVNAGKEPTDAEVAAVVARAIKQRLDSIEQFRAGGRDDLVRKEQREVDLIRTYQPKQLTQAEIEELARQAIAETGAASKGDAGRVMKILMPQVKGRADGRLVNQVVAALLGA